MEDPEASKWRSMGLRGHEESVTTSTKRTSDIMMGEKISWDSMGFSRIYWDSVGLNGNWWESMGFNRISLGYNQEYDDLGYSRA
jgi:hypothetical protein